MANGNEWEIEFQILLESCGFQDEIVKKAINTRKDSDIYFKEQFNTLKVLKDEWKQKNDNLNEMKLIQKKYLQKTENTRKNMAVINKDIADLLEENFKLNSKLNSLSDDLTEKIQVMDEDLKMLVSKFDDVTLTDLVEETATNILSYEDVQQQLGDDFKNAVMIVNEYEKIKIPSIINKNSANNNIQYMLNKIADKENNIQFLTNELANILK